MIMVFNVTFNNMSVISWRSVLLFEEIGVLREDHWPAASHWQTLSHNVVSSTPRHEPRNQNVISDKCSFLFGQFWSMSTELELEISYPDKS